MKNKNKFEFTLLGKKGRIKEKSPPPQQRSQPVIMGRFISSGAFCLRDADESGTDKSNTIDKNNNNKETSVGSSSSSMTILKSSFVKESQKAKQDFESATTTTTKSKRNDDENKEGGKNVKIYLSNKQTSDVRMEGGVVFPGAPPATPRESYSRYVHFVPAMSDIRSQRQLRNTLEGLEQRQKAKAERLELAAKDVEAERRREAAAKLKLAQRKEIYELNRIMEDLEHNNFLRFCMKKGIEVNE